MDIDEPVGAPVLASGRAHEAEGGVYVNKSVCVRACAFMRVRTCVRSAYEAAHAIKGLLA